MKVVSIDIPHSSRSNNFILTFVGDIHLGANDCDEDLLKKVINKLANAEPFHYWFGMGDYGEYIGLRDKRFQAEDLHKSMKPKDINDIFGWQTKRVKQFLEPAQKNLIGLIEGNHDRDVSNRYNFNVYTKLCEGLKTRELGYCCLVRLNFKRTIGKNISTKQFKILLHHGHGGGRRDGSKLSKVEDLIWIYPNADLYVSGHTHGRFVTVRSFYYAHYSKDILLKRPVGFGVSGSFKETYAQNQSGYGEIKGYPPSHLGCISFIINPYAYEKDGSDKLCFEITPHASSNGLPA